MLGQLPITLDNLGLVDAMIKLRISDDFAAEAERIERLTLRLLLSDPGTENLSEHQKLTLRPSILSGIDRSCSPHRCERV